MGQAAGHRRRDNVSLRRRAWNIRRHALLMGEVQGQGYIGQALGIADVLAVSYFHAMTFRANEPEWDGSVFVVYRSLCHRALCRAD